MIREDILMIHQDQAHIHTTQIQPRIGLLHMVWEVDTQHSGSQIYQVQVSMTVTLQKRENERDVQVLVLANVGMES